MKIRLLICIAGLSTSCSQQEVDFIIDVDYLKTALQQELPELASDDLKMTITASDYLPTGWEYNGDERFFEMERRAVKGGWISIYYMKTQEVVIDIRVATYVDTKLIHNFPIWSYSDDRADYSRVRKVDSQYTIELYKNGQLSNTYYPQQGKLVLNKK
ncbi:MAG: hypothetical protein AAFO02_18110 [Bacteroidota bacterium]